MADRFVELLIRIAVFFVGKTIDFFIQICIKKLYFHRMTLRNSSFNYEILWFDYHILLYQLQVIISKFNLDKKSPRKKCVIFLIKSFKHHWKTKYFLT